MYAMSGQAWSRKYNAYAPVYEVYADVMKVLNPSEDIADKETLEKAKLYRDDLLGKTALKQAPDEYYDIRMALDLHIDLERWNTMPMETKAKIIAQKYLENMVAIIDAHYKKQDESQKKKNTVATGTGKGGKRGK